MRVSVDLADALRALIRSSGSCMYLDARGQRVFRDFITSEPRVRDVEELYKLGERLSICAYYGSRLAVPPAHLGTYVMSLVASVFCFLLEE